MDHPLPFLALLVFFGLCDVLQQQRQSLPHSREPLLFGPAFYLDSHPHRCSPDALDLSDLSWWLPDQPPCPLSLLPPSLHHHQRSLPKSQQGTTNCPQEQTQFLPGELRPPCSGPSLHIQLPLPHNTPYSGFLKQISHTHASGHGISTLFSAKTILPSFTPHDHQHCFLTNSYLASSFKSKISCMDLSPLTLGKKHSLHFKLLMHAL